MSRCGCASNSCACLIQPGPGIEVAGSGSSNAPYIISLASGFGGGGGFTDAEIGALISDSGSATGAAVLSVANTRAAAAVNAHLAAADPHSQYMTVTEGDVRYYTKSALDLALGVINDRLTALEAGGGGGGGSGDVVGPGGATNGHVAIYSGSSGKVIADSGVTISGNNTGDQTLADLGGVPIAGAVTKTGVMTFNSYPILGASVGAPSTGLQFITKAFAEGLVAALLDGTTGNILDTLIPDLTTAIITAGRFAAERLPSSMAFFVRRDGVLHDGAWPARPTADTSQVVIYAGVGPSPFIGGGSAINGTDFWFENAG